MPTLPLMPIRDVVLFPLQMAPFVVGRAASVRALEAALAADSRMVVATQRDAAVDEPTADEVYRVGTLIHIVQSLKLPDGNIKVLVEGVERVHVLSLATEEGCWRAEFETAAAGADPGRRDDALVARVSALFERYLKLTANLNYEVVPAAVMAGEDPGRVADLIASNLVLSVPDKQALLELFDPLDRLRRIARILADACEDFDQPGPALHLEVDLPAPPERVYEILLDANQFGAFSNMKAVIPARAGGAFQLFGGLVEGRTLELVEGQRIVQAWRRRSWPAGVWSIVRFELSASGEGTRLALEHTGISEDQWQELKDGWQANYWTPLARYLTSKRRQR